jgi:hypothetical protein
MNASRVAPRALVAVAPAIAYALSVAMIRDKQKMKRKDVGLDAFGPFFLSCRTLRR